MIKINSSNLSKVKVNDDFFSVACNIMDAKKIFRDLGSSTIVMLNMRNYKFAFCNNLDEVKEFLNIE